MTTTVTATQPPTYVTPGTATTLAASAATNSPESTLASIANSLMGLTNSSINQPATNPRMFARMERLVDSLARLIDAFANFRSASKTEPQPTQPVVAPPTAEPTQTAPADVATPVVAPVTEVPPQPVVEAPTPAAPSTPQIEIGQLLGKTGGFLWKPVSDKNGDLAILLPKQLTGKVKEVRILNPDGTKSIAKGKYSGVGNGNREHFRFAKPGSGYPDGAIVLIKLEDGSARHVRISDTSRRIER
jgi:hypothetical protein